MSTARASGLKELEAAILSSTNDRRERAGQLTVTGRLLAKLGSHPGDKLVHVEGLGDVVGGAGVKAGDAIGELVGARHQDDGNRSRVAPAAQLAKDLKPGEARHPVVEQDEAKLAMSQDFDGLDAIAGELLSRFQCYAEDPPRR